MSPPATDPRKRAQYKTINWAQYNAALKRRGSLLVWIDPTMQWYAKYVFSPQPESKAVVERQRPAKLAEVNT